MTVALHSASVAICLVSSIYFLIGCIGFNSQKEAIESVPWITSSRDGIEASFGLRTIYIKADSVGNTLDYSAFNCSYDFCLDCQRDGIAALGLVAVALIFTFFAGVTSSCLLKTENMCLRVMSIVFSFIAAVTSSVSVGVFMGNCFKEIKEDTDDDHSTYYFNYFDEQLQHEVNPHWGIGAVLVLIGVLLMWILVVSQLVFCCVGGKQQPLLQQSSTVTQLEKK